MFKSWFLKVAVLIVVLIVVFYLGVTYWVNKKIPDINLISNCDTNIVASTEDYGLTGVEIKSVRVYEPVIDEVSWYFSPDEKFLRKQNKIDISFEARDSDENIVSDIAQCFYTTIIGQTQLAPAGVDHVQLEGYFDQNTEYDNDFWSSKAWYISDDFTSGSLSQKIKYLSIDIQID
ncbi:hypothetical protein [Ignatzschineria sp. LJL83]